MNASIEQKRREEQAQMQRREDVHWNRQVNKAKKKSLQDGVLEAIESNDAKWYVEVDGEWVECSQSYYCPHCKKHLSDSTLQAHLQSDGHKKQMRWLSDESTDCPSTDGGSDC